MSNQYCQVSVINAQASHRDSRRLFRHFPRVRLKVLEINPRKVGLALLWIYWAGKKIKRGETFHLLLQEIGTNL